MTRVAILIEERERLLLEALGFGLGLQSAQATLSYVVRYLVGGLTLPGSKSHAFVLELFGAGAIDGAVLELARAEAPEQDRPTHEYHVQVFDPLGTSIAGSCFYAVDDREAENEVQRFAQVMCSWAPRSARVRNQATGRVWSFALKVEHDSEAL